MLWLPPVNDPVRDALDAQVRHFSHLVTLATVTVAIGVALEGIEIIHEGVAWATRKKQKRRERSNEKELAEIFPVCDTREERPEAQTGEPRWVKRLLRIGLILVVVGVVGEWKYGARLEDAHNAIHSYDVGKLTEAAREAGNAQVSATDAANAAFRAIGSAQTAQSVSRNAGSVASEAIASASNALSLADGAHKQAESAERLIEDERKTRLELQKSLTPRQFEFIQVGNETTFDDLKPFHQMRVILEYIPDGGECELAASAIIELVTKAGWKIDSTTPNRNERPGVFVEWYMHFEHTEPAYAAEKQSREAAQELVSFLKASDWVTEGRGAGERMNNIPEGTVRVHVGYKPLPFFESSVIKELREADPYVDTDEIARIKKIKDRRERLEKEVVLQWEEGLRRFQRPSK